MVFTVPENLVVQFSHLLAIFFKTSKGIKNHEGVLLLYFVS